MISDLISDDIPPQMNILGMFIPILMHCSSGCTCLLLKSVLSQIGALQAICQPMKCDLINDIKLFPTVHRGYTVAHF